MDIQDIYASGNTKPSNFTSIFGSITEEDDGAEGVFGENDDRANLRTGHYAGKTSIPFSNVVSDENESNNMEVNTADSENEAALAPNSTLQSSVISPQIPSTMITASGGSEGNSNKMPTSDAGGCESRKNSAQQHILLSTEDVYCPSEDGDANNLILFDTILFDFNPKRFFQQLAVHVLYFVTPFILENPAAQGFLKLNPAHPPLWFNHIFPIMIYIMVCSYFATDKENQETLGGAVYLPLILFLQHRFTVAIKYATLSDTEYQRFIECDEEDILTLYQTQMQLITGWLNRDEAVLEFELGAAAARVGATISDINFTIPPPIAGSSESNQFQYWSTFMKGDEFVDTDSAPAKELKPLPNGDYAISVFDLCLVLIRRADNVYEHNDMLRVIILYTYTVINVLVPFMLIIANSDTIHVDGWLVVFLICSSIINYQFGLVVYNLLYVSVFDVMRQLRMIMDLNELIRTSDVVLNSKIKTNSEEAEISIEKDKKNVSQTRRGSIMSISKQAKLSHLAKNTSGPSHVDHKEQAHARRRSSTENVRARKFSFTGASASTGARNSIETHYGERYHNAAVRRGSASENHAPSRSGSGRLRTMSFAAVGEKRADHKSVSIVPRIPMGHDPQNIIAWVHARLVLQHFGRRFRLRIDVYLGGSIGLTLVLMVYSLATILSTDLADRRQEFHSSYLLQSLLAITVSLICVVALLFIAALVNRHMLFHAQSLAYHQASVNRRILMCLADPHLLKHLPALKDLRKFVDYSLSIIQTSNLSNPFRLFGIIAENTVTVSVITTAISFYGILASLYLSSDESTSSSGVV